MAPGVSPRAFFGASLAGLYSRRAMVLVLGVGFLVSCAIGPRHGLLRRFLRPAHHHQEESDEHCDVPGHRH